VVAVGAPHHVTQRGNARQDVFVNDGLRRVCLDLLAKHAGKNSLRVVDSPPISCCVRSGIGRRQATPDQDIGAQVGAVGPNQCAAFHAQLHKSHFVVPNLRENWAHQHWSEVPLDYATVGQGEFYTVVAQRLRLPYANQFHISSLVQWSDGFQRRSTTSPFPVDSQFLPMKGCPFEYQRHGSPWEISP
jgi:hypothetical protein